tara:strand:- start:2252 stop:3430 length:1179 start_codon:yes stop_codon:yes gene_type:complete
LSSNLKITVVGSGYVGMSLSVLMAQNNDVTVLEIDKNKIKKINKRQPTIKDEELENFLNSKTLTLTATIDKEIAYSDARFIIIATPTNFDEKKKSFDTSALEGVVEDALRLNNDALIIIKSTVPIGFTKFLQDKYKTDRIIFSPEFLREGSALKDNLYPSRIIIGGFSNLAKEFGKLLKIACEDDHAKLLYVNSSEAEAIKLFSNTYLAMRVSFFNELDSYSLANNLDTKNIIKGICLDDRIGFGYNNPSFGYGGYCLPKDTKQLLADFSSIPQNLIESIVRSNETRKTFLTEKILNQNPNIVGIHRLIMKEGSDNFRSSSIKDIINDLISAGIKIIIFEPLLKESSFDGIEIENDLYKFKERSEIIVTNRMSNDLNDCRSKIFTRDIFREN